MTVSVTGSFPGVPVVLQPGGTDNIAVAIISGSYSGFEGIFETSTNGTVWTPLQGISMASYTPDGPYITPPGGYAFSWAFNIVPAVNAFIRLRSIAYGSGTINVTLVSAILAGGVPVLNQQPTPVDVGLSGAAIQLAPSMPAVAGKFNFVTGIRVDGNGATAGSLQAATMSGVLKSFAFIFVVPAGASTPLGGGALNITFNPPLQASAVNQAVTLTVPSFGSGNTAALAEITGYTL